MLAGFGAVRCRHERSWNFDTTIALSVLEPYFDAVRDTFSAYRPTVGHAPFSEVMRTRLEIDEGAHDSERHFAATRTDGKLMRVAPEIVQLAQDSIIAILAHEFGHVLDFLYPACFSWPKTEAGSVTWVGRAASERALAWRLSFGKPDARSRPGSKDDENTAENWIAAWNRRNDDQVEWAADGIAELVVGKRPRYCGPCMIQCFSGGVERPAGLR